MSTAEIKSRLMEQLEDRFVTWAKGRPDIRAAIVIGSRARRERPADAWSDLDIVFFTTNLHELRVNAGGCPGQILGA